MRADARRCEQSSRVRECGAASAEYYAGVDAFAFSEVFLNHSKAHIREHIMLTN